MNDILQLLKSNKEWIFSGIGVFILSGLMWIIKRFITTKRHNAQNAAKTPIPTFGRGHGNTNIAGNPIFNAPIFNNAHIVFLGDDSFLHQSHRQINFEKFIEAAEKELKPGEKIEAKVFGKIMFEKPYDGEIIRGLFAATNHRLLIISPSTSNKKNLGLAYHQIGGVKVQDGIINVILPDEIFTLSSINDDAQHEFEKFFKYCSDKKKPPEVEEKQ